MRLVLALLAGVSLGGCTMIFPFEAERSDAAFRDGDGGAAAPNFEGDGDADADADADADVDADVDVHADPDAGPRGECTRGAVANEPCGNCGTHSRTCHEDETWGEWGECTGEGECPAGSDETDTCQQQGGSGGVGTTYHVCDENCQWEPWSTCA